MVSNDAYKKKKARRHKCIFIIFVYIQKIVFILILPEAAYQGVLFILSLIDYKDIDDKFSSCAITKLIGYLWYFSSETTIVI
jgi:hypothetical protein